MAKTKAPENTAKTDLELADQILTQLNKDFKSNIVTKASDFVEGEDEIVDVCPMMNIGLGGGIPKGTITVISGKPKLGKTSLVLHICKKAQQAGTFIYYLNIEARLKTRDLMGAGINLDNCRIIGSTSEKILSAEDFLTATESIIKGHKGCIVVLDSISALCSMKEQTDEISGQTRSIGPKLLATFLRRNTGVIKVNNIGLFAIQHVIANTSGYGSPYMEDGGNKIVYASDTKMRAKTAAPWKVGDSQVGQITDWEIVFSPLGPPGKKVQTYLRYGQGIDETMELVNLGVDFGVIEKSGAWFTWNNMKVQGLEKLKDAIQESNKVDELRSTIRDIIQ